MPERFNANIVLTEKQHYVPAAVSEYGMTTAMVMNIRFYAKVVTMTIIPAVKDAIVYFTETTQTILTEA